MQVRMQDCIDLQAVWDSGVGMSSVSENIFQKLGLQADDKIEI